MYDQKSAAEFVLTKLSTNIPVNLSPSNFSLDAVQCVLLKNRIHLFVRSQTNSSRLFWSYSSENDTSDWSKCVAIGSSDERLHYDAYAVINTFVERLEVFGVFGDGEMLHTWQTSETSFEDKWHRLCLFPPKFNSAPVVHTMGPSFFNGILEVFVRGEDGTTHHIHQTICDKVHFPWGPCTWELAFHKLGSGLPADKSSQNPFTVSRNIHLGIEVNLTL